MTAAVDHDHLNAPPFGLPAPDDAAAQIRAAFEAQARMIRSLVRTREGIARQRDALRQGLGAIEAALAAGDAAAALDIVRYLRWEQECIAADHGRAKDGASPPARHARAG